MKKDPEALHKEKMHELHALFTKKTQYHSQKAYLELKDIYWLVQEFFGTFLGKNIHFTEEELTKELREFKHEFMTIDAALLEQWHAFFHKLSYHQYAGLDIEQEELKGLLATFTHLVDETVGRERAPQDPFTQHIQTAQIYIKHGEMEEAEEAYKKLMAEYERLSEEKKKQHYEQLEHLYQAIAGARSA
jgi:hypothetical protein